MATPTPAVSNFNRLFDSNYQLQDDAAQITASAAGTVAGSAKVVDLVPGTTSGDPAGVISGDLVIDVNTIDATTGDELYRIKLQLSASSTFASGIVDSGAQIELGGATSKTGGETGTDTVGRYIIRFWNVRKGTSYRYARIYFLLTGTTPILDAEAYLSLKGP